MTESRGNIRVGVKRAAWLRALDAGYGPQPVQHKLPPLRILRKHDAHRLLRTVQGLDRGLLRNRCRIRSRVALQLYDGVDNLRPCKDVSDSPAGHRVRLRHRSRNDDVALEIRMRCDGERLSPVIEKVRVALIGNQEDAAFVAELRDEAELAVVENRTARVIRRIHDDNPRARGESE